MRFYNGFNFPCSIDYLLVTNENNVSVVEYCDHLTGKFSVVDVPGDYVRINFHSGKDDFSSGQFLVTFNAVQPCKYIYNEVFEFSVV